MFFMSAIQVCLTRMWEPHFALADLCEKEPFLNTDEGAPYRPVFKHVRLQYIINDLASARILERDNILPPGET